MASTLDLDRNGINAEMLLSNDGSLPEIDAVTNKIVLELAQFKDCHQCTFKSLYKWIKDLFGVKWPLNEVPTPPAVAKSIE